MIRRTCSVLVAGFQFSAEMMGRQTWGWSVRFSFRLCSFTYLALIINVWVVDLSPEGHLWWFEWILGREHQVNQEGTLIVTRKMSSEHSLLKAYLVIRSLVRDQQALPDQQVALVYLLSQEDCQGSSFLWILAWTSRNDLLAEFLKSPNSFWSLLVAAIV